VNKLNKMTRASCCKVERNQPSGLVSLMYVLCCNEASWNKIRGSVLYFAQFCFILFYFLLFTSNTQGYARGPVRPAFKQAQTYSSPQRVPGPKSAFLVGPSPPIWPGFRRTTIYDACDRPKIKKMLKSGPCLTNCVIPLLLTLTCSLTIGTSITIRRF
jgi:hypothetical protein